MSYAIDFVAVVFAVAALMTAWFYGSLFERWREYAKEREHTFFGALVTCPLCLAYHLSFWVVVLLWLPIVLLPAPWNELPRALLYALAATTLVHYVHGVLPLQEEEENNG